MLATCQRGTSRLCAVGPVVRLAPEWGMGKWGKNTNKDGEIVFKLFWGIPAASRRYCSSNRVAITQISRCVGHLFGLFRFFNGVQLFDVLHFQMVVQRVFIY